MMRAAPSWKPDSWTCQARQHFPMPAVVVRKIVHIGKNELTLPFIVCPRHAIQYAKEPLNGEAHIRLTPASATSALVPSPLPRSRSLAVSSGNVLDELNGKEQLCLDHQGDRLVLVDTVKMKMTGIVVVASQRHSR